MRTIATYQRLKNHVQAWVEGQIDSLLIFGQAGLGKTSAVLNALNGRQYQLFRAHQSPLEIYLGLYDNPNLPCVLDDVSGLLKNPAGIDLLKCLCETGSKTLRWGTTTERLEGRGKQFVFNASVLIILNRIPHKDEDTLAVMDRCDTIEFIPTKAEVLDKMRKVFPLDMELIDLLGELPVLPTLRTLIKARQWQNSPYLNLIEELSAECGVSPAVQVLVEIMKNQPSEQWLECYQKATGFSDRTYRRHKLIAEELLAGGQTDSEIGMAA